MFTEAQDKLEAIVKVLNEKRESLRKLVKDGGEFEVRKSERYQI